MITTAASASVISSFIDLVWHYMYELSNLVLGALGLASNVAVDSWSANFLVVYYESVVRWLAFDEFQIKLLKGLLFILCANICLIYMSWKVYGKRISEKFMRPVTSKTIEDLKRSVSSLKLPKEHSPRV
jgi:uncharacterized membrane-anchored protein YitT (DUF2179 family)